MMPDDQTNTNTEESQPVANVPGASDVAPADASAVMAEVADKLSEAHNILMALSSDPTVDEMCAAIGLSLALDRAGKRATAIYSGSTPNALEFLRPEETFDASADILQDFVIALNKDKADHLRYKLDGDYVKIFITPYKTRISEEDLEFSYGDYNIDLVLALNVSNGADLDSALREHGRIMHDATIVNLTAGNPGKFGDLQWSDRSASSVCEMAARLLLSVNGNAIDKEDATALLTGVVAATNRFSKPNTTAETMDVAGKLMAAGADQQLISQNITADINNTGLGGLGSLDQRPSNREQDETALEIDHDELAKAEEASEDAEIAEGAETGALLADLKAAEESLANAAEEPLETPEVKPEKVIAPTVDFADTINNADKYGQMMEQALADVALEAPAGTPGVQPVTSGNLAASVAPEVAAEPEINGVPEINYMPMPGEEVLPPPPTPPIDMSGAMPPADATPGVTPTEVEPIQPAEPTPEAQPEPLGAQPAMQDQVYNETASNPGAFKIPGA